MVNNEKIKILVEIGTNILLAGRPIDEMFLKSVINMESRYIHENLKYDLLDDIVGFATVRSMAVGGVKFVKNIDKPLQKPAGNWKNNLIFRKKDKKYKIVICSEERVNGSPIKREFICQIIGREMSNILKKKYGCIFFKESTKRSENNYAKIEKLADSSVISAVNKTFEIYGNRIKELMEECDS